MLQNGWTVEASVPAHVQPIADRMRDIDRVEAQAFGHSPAQAPRLGLSSGAICCTALYRGEPEAMFGLTVQSLLAGIGRPWLLGTDRLEQGMRELVVWAPRFLRAMEAITPLLENHVAVENARSIRYLRWLGFVVEREPVTIGGVPMLHFSKGFPGV